MPFNRKNVFFIYLMCINYAAYSFLVEDIKALLGKFARHEHVKSVAVGLLGARLGFAFWDYINTRKQLRAAQKAWDKKVDEGAAGGTFTGNRYEILKLEEKTCVQVYIGETHVMYTFPTKAISFSHLNENMNLESARFEWTSKIKLQKEDDFEVVIKTYENGLLKNVQVKFPFKEEAQIVKIVQYSTLLTMDWCKNDELDQRQMNISFTARDKGVLDNLITFKNRSPDIKKQRIWSNLENRYYLERFVYGRADFSTAIHEAGHCLERFIRTKTLPDIVTLFKGENGVHGVNKICPLYISLNSSFVIAIFKKLLYVGNAVYMRIKNKIFSSARLTENDETYYKNNVAISIAGVAAEYVMQSGEDEEMQNWESVSNKFLWTAKHIERQEKEKKSGVLSKNSESDGWSAFWNAKKYYECKNTMTYVGSIWNYQDVVKEIMDCITKEYEKVIIELQEEKNKKRLFCIADALLTKGILYKEDLEKIFKMEILQNLSHTHSYGETIPYPEGAPLSYAHLRYTFSTFMLKSALLSTLITIGGTFALKKYFSLGNSLFSPYLHAVALSVTPLLTIGVLIPRIKHFFIARKEYLKDKEKYTEYTNLKEFYPRPDTLKNTTN